MLYICISFDYELFMGKNYVEEEKVLIEPSAALSDMLMEEGVSGCFFADVCCPMQYRKFGNMEFPAQFDCQLQELVKKRQDVQLHIHPHWLKATKIANDVEFDREYYRLHSWLKESPDAVDKIIHDGVEYLNHVLKPVMPDYKCVAYRAGGYCIQPEQQLASTLYREGIRIDSSVCYGHSHIGDGMQYDYREIVPNSNCYFNNTHTINENIQHSIPNGILEVPVASYGTFPYRIVASKLNGKITDRPATGYGMRLQSTGNMQRKRTLRNRIKQSIKATNMVTFDYYNEASMSYMINRLYREMSCKKKDVFLATIAHPKGMSKEHIKNMRNVIRRAQKKPNISFVSMRQIADICSLMNL